jgi:spore coat protein A, manganese oxidase
LVLTIFIFISPFCCFRYRFNSTRGGDFCIFWWFQPGFIYSDASFIFEEVQMVSRRQFLQLGALAAAGLAVPVEWLSSPTLALAFSQSDKLRKFIQPLRGVGGSGIPVAAADSVAQPWWQPGVTHYTIDVNQYEDQLHPDLPHATRLRGFGQNGVFRHLGGIIAAKRGEPVQITFRNNLPPDYILPVDDTIMGVMGNQTNRVDVHLHGGFVPWISDGGPFAWWDPDGHRGEGFQSQFLKPVGLANNEAEYYYPNQQSARLMWYHDHTFGMTRTNAYAGIASAYVIYDDYELELVKKHFLPGPLDKRTVYMVFQDKIFVSAEIEDRDPTWSTIMPNSRSGDLWYAHQYETSRWEQGPVGTPPTISAIPEYFGDTMLVNGLVAPTVTLEQRQYRFRLLNACQARFLNPRLVYAKGKAFPDNTEPNLKAPGPGFIQIGTEGGFLPQPAMVSWPRQTLLTLAPAERADLIVDLRNVPAGSTLILYSDAPAPYPMGDPLNDYYPGNPSTPRSVPGYAPNTRTLLQIKVVKRVGAADPSITLPAALHPTDLFMVRQVPGKPTPIPPGVKVRYLTLNEDFDDLGRLIQREGTNESIYINNEGNTTFARNYMDAATEVVPAGTTEVWEVINLTGDTHPIHLHLVNFQVLSRQPFDAENYAGGKPIYTGPAYAPDLNELGYKETCRMNPGEVTRILMKFNLPSTPFAVPASTRTGGHEYVWHCHILEHEEHDMMRPLIVT